VRNENSEPLTHRERIRRVVLLCCSFSRNVAFYRAGQMEEALPLLLNEQQPELAFWRQANSNFLDMAVLDWCKLFGDHANTPTTRMGKHHWRRVVSDPTAFELGLLGRLRLSGSDFADLITKMRQYRDGFVAHLDDGRVMEPPELGVAGEAVDHYHCHIVEREALPGELAGLPSSFGFAMGYHQAAAEAARVYRRALKS
jgi:hypothetical protein